MLEFFSDNKKLQTGKRSLAEVILLAANTVAIFIISPFVVIRFLREEWLTAIVDLAFVFCLISVLVYVLKTREVKKASFVVALLTTAAVFASLLINGFDNIYWAYPVVIGLFYLFSHNTAIIINAFFITLTMFLIYRETSLIEFSSVIATLIVTAFLSWIFSRVNREHHRKMLKNEHLLNLRNESLEFIVNTDVLSEVLAHIVENIESTYPEMRCSILILDEEGKCLSIGAAPSLPDFYNQAIDGIQIGEGIGSCYTAAYRGERVIVSDISESVHWGDFKELALKANIKSCWSQPILNAKGNVLGTFAVYHDDVSEPTEQDFLVIDQFAHLASIAIERDQNTQLIWRQANFDHLTGLPNRNMMQVQLNKAIRMAKRQDKKLAIIFLDLDNFKDINDSLGHDAGDALLIEAAERIQSCIRASDTVARLGGDEFVLILENIEDKLCIEGVASKVLAHLSAPYLLNNERAYSSASIGVTVYPDDGQESDALLKNADQAMYGAKQRGRNNVHYFTESMREQMLERMSLVQDLRQALINEELFTVFQPIVDLHGNKISKAEVLIRWQHPKLGLVSPMQFIPLAEETGLIIEISDWVFHKTAPLIKQWREQYHADFQISINTSPMQYKSGFANITKWLDWLDEYQLGEQAFAFEITENLLMESHHDVYQILANIRERGVAISIDDFGTGYSSFNYLKKYPTDFIKIDKGFIHKISESNKDLALCEAMIVMAKKMGMKVIAEGVETSEQSQLLAAIGCDFVQGYLYTKPLPLEQFENYLSESSK